MIINFKHLNGVSNEVGLDTNFISCYKANNETKGTTFILKNGEEEVLVAESIEKVEKIFKEKEIKIPRCDD